MTVMGSILIAAACVGIGLYRAARYQKRVVSLERSIELLCTWQAEIRFSGYSAPELIGRHKDKAAWLKDCQNRIELGEEFPQAWRQAMETSALWPPERSILEQLGESFGQSDIEGQLSLLSLCQDRLREILLKAKEERTQQSRLSPMLGAAAGAVLLLFLL